MSTSAFVLIKIQKTILKQIKTKSCELKKQLKLIDGVESVYMVEPSDVPFDVVSRVNTTSIESLYNIILNSISTAPGVKETTTMIIIDQ